MIQSLLLLAGVLGAQRDADLPPAPDFFAMIPQISANLPASEREKYEPAMAEATALARYMTRVWARTIRDQSSDQILNLTTVAQQFDCALASLNPNPTVDEAIARVRVFQAVLAVAQNQLRLEPRLRNDFQFNAQIVRIRRLIEEQYWPLFRRAV